MAESSEERSRFENAVRDTRGRLRLAALSMTRLLDNVYADKLVQAAWEGWQARAELAVPAVPAEPDLICSRCDAPLKRLPVPAEGGTTPWTPLVEAVRREMQSRFSDKLSMEEIASCAYAIGSVPAPSEATPAKDDDLCVCGYLYSQHTGAKPMCPITCDSGGRCDFIFTPIPAIAPAQTLAYFNSREDLLAGKREKEEK